MKKYSCILVDDEPLSRELIADYLIDCPELDLQGIFANAVDARTFLQETSVDLLLLDINMPRLSGIGLVKSLAQAPEVIFITAYVKYAVEGFELEAVDYLLKPIEQDRFFKAVNRFLQKMDQREPQPDFIMVKSDKKMYRIELSQILYVEAMGDYIRLVTKDKKLTIYDRLASFLEKLPNEEFCQIHKSHFISLSNLEYLEGTQIRIGDVYLPVSKSFRAALVERLNR